MNNDSNIIEIENLSRKFGAKLALEQILLSVPRGIVLGLVGANGAGKTTLIKHIMGLLKPQTGSVKVFGVDPSSHPVKVLSALGYLSEDRDLPPWMTIAELFRYSRAFRKNWDDTYVEELRLKFQLQSTAQIRHLSKGELAKAGLIVALAYRPELLVLDEPSSGLDPIVRREMLEAVVRSVAEEGRTVLFSSHLLDEIVRVSDRVAMMAQGRILLHGPLHEVLESHHRIVIRLRQQSACLSDLPGILSISGGPEEWTLLCYGERHLISGHVLQLGGEVLEESTVTFEEIFHARVNHQAGQCQKV